MRAEFKTLERSEDRVVVEGKIRNGFWKLIVHDDGSFIRRPETARDCFQAFLNLLSLFLREVVVDENDGRKRKRIGGEELNLLLDVVVKNAEVIALQAGDELALPVFYRNGDNDGVRTRNDSRRALLGIARRLGGRRRLLRLRGLLRLLGLRLLRRPSGREENHPAKCEYCSSDAACRKQSSHRKLLRPFGARPPAHRRCVPQPQKIILPGARRLSSAALGHG